MKRIDEIIANYDSNERKDQKKIQLIEWFQQYPGHRFDRSEVYEELGDELEIGRKQIGNYLEELCEEDVLTPYGEQRKAYELSVDILVPAKYQAKAALKHLFAIFDIQRWGIAGVSAVTTAIWAVMTLPFWLLWVSLVLSPSNNFGAFTRPNLFTMAVAMTIWFIISSIITSVLYWLHRYRS